MLSALLYFIAGAGAIFTAINADSTSRQILWWAIGVAFLMLCGTLVATLRARSKP